jgi:DNA-binding IclR family transcriptional regulator
MSGRSESASRAYRESNSTADRALNILMMFDDARLSISGTEVARELDVARSTAYRYLQSLVRSHFLEEADHGGYRLGRRTLELARLARRGMGLSEVARPVMKRLATEVGEAVLLTRMSGSAAICIEREDAANRAVRISYERGQALPINAGASAFALLAWLPTSTIEETLSGVRFHRFTERTLTSKREIMRRLERTRDQGYAVSRAELDPDVLAVAAPLRNADDEVVAAIGIVAVAGGEFEQRLPKLAAAVCDAASEISAGIALRD